MKLYWVHLCDEVEGSAGFKFESTLPAARMRVAEFKRDIKFRPKERQGRAQCTIETIHVETTKAGILKALNKYGGHSADG